MFAVYNILINKNGFGSGTFTKLFQSTSYVEDTDAQFYQFMQFEGQVDYFADNFINQLETQESVLRDLGLRSAQTEQYVKSTDKTDVKYFKIYNNNIRGYDVYERGESEYSVKKLRNSENEVNKYLIDDFMTSEIDVKEEASIKNINDFVNTVYDKLSNVGEIIITIDC